VKTFYGTRQLDSWRKGMGRLSAWQDSIVNHFFERAGPGKKRTHLEILCRIGPKGGGEIPGEKELIRGCAEDRRSLSTVAVQRGAVSLGERRGEKEL